MNNIEKKYNNYIDYLITLKNINKSIEIFKHDLLESIVEELNPHFSEHGFLMIIHNRIVLKYHKRHYNANINKWSNNYDTVLCINDDEFNNDFDDVYEYTKIDKHSVFENIGTELNVLKIKGD